MAKHPHDMKGKALKVGDRVLIPANILSAGDDGKVVLRLSTPNPSVLPAGAIEADLVLDGSRVRKTEKKD